MASLKRCHAGIDNAGGCDGRHTPWHTHRDAKSCPGMSYDYDRCRREAGHEVDTSRPFHEVHLLDCGGEFYDDGTTDFTEHWMYVYDYVKMSGERLEWR